MTALSSDATLFDLHICTYYFSACLFRRTCKLATCVQKLVRFPGIHIHGTYKAKEKKEKKKDETDTYARRVDVIVTHVLIFKRKLNVLLFLIRTSVKAK